MPWWWILYLTSTSSHNGGLDLWSTHISMQRPYGKKSKYTAITRTHIFVPVAVETLGQSMPMVCISLDQIGGKLSAISGNPRESSFLYQRLPVLVQRFNMIAFHSFLFQRWTSKFSHFRLCFYLYFDPSRSIISRVLKI